MKLTIRNLPAPQFDSPQPFTTMAARAANCACQFAQAHPEGNPETRDVSIYPDGVSISVYWTKARTLVAYVADRRTP